MVADDLVSLLLFGHDVAPTGDSVANKRETNSDEAVLNEIHLCNLHVFIVNDFVIISGIETSRNKSVRNVTQKLLVLKSINVEETSLLPEQVCK